MTILILLTTLFGFPSASAMGRGSGPCEPAMDEFCGGLLEFSHDAVMKCLKEHEADVSPACRNLLKNWKPSDQADTSKSSDRT
jgi:hypothetical protein